MAQEALPPEFEMNIENLIAIADFLGEEMTDLQTSRLMDESRRLSIADRERLLSIIGGPLYTEISMHDAEMGSLSRY